MIVDALLHVMLLIPNWILSHMPTFTAPFVASVESGADPSCHWTAVCNVFSYLSYGKAWIDFSALGLVVGVVMDAILLVLGVRLVIWIYDKFPFKAS